MGSISVDFLAAMASYPKPDDITRSTDLKVSKEGNSPFTIVDNQTKTRTCIHTPGYPPVLADELLESSLKSALDGARLVHFDVRLPETCLRVANEAVLRNIPILIDAERLREGLDNLLIRANYLVCSAKFPQPIARITAEGIGTIMGRLLVGTAEKIPPSELVDTTGAGDAFIGATLNGSCQLPSTGSSSRPSLTSDLRLAAFS